MGWASKGLGSQIIEKYSVWELRKNMKNERERISFERERERERKRGESVFFFLISESHFSIRGCNLLFIQEKGTRFLVLQKIYYNSSNSQLVGVEEASGFWMFADLEKASRCLLRVK